MDAILHMLNDNHSLTLSGWVWLIALMPVAFGMVLAMMGLMYLNFIWEWIKQ